MKGMGIIMGRKDEKIKWRQAVRNILLYACGFVWMLPEGSASADIVEPAGSPLAPGPLWMGPVIAIIVGLMVILAIAAICFMHKQKKKEEEARRQREEAEREA